MLHIQAPSIAHESAQCAASRQMCYKQRWTLSVTNLRLN